MKPVYCYLLIHPDWLKGSPGTVGWPWVGRLQRCTRGRHGPLVSGATEESGLVEVRGRIKLTEDTSQLETSNAGARRGTKSAEQPAVAEAESEEADEGDAEDRKQYGVPRFLTLADGRRMDTRRGTIPKQSHFACGACGMSQDIRESVQATQHGAPWRSTPFRVTARSAMRERRIYGGRFFAAPVVD